MRSFFYVVAALAVIGLAFWSYQENYKTRASLKVVSKIQQQIGQARETLTVLKAEWAYLNRPERLRELAEINFDHLGLLPLSPEQFGRIDQVTFSTPDSGPGLGPVTGPVNVSAKLEQGQ
ncbi:MAG TPA: cell division protein FtsL [Rhodobacteraceae bacterium]|jgi:hypothetical protein|nr:cell division protein FtsL [Paracoccaceae bacterium]